MRYVTVGLMVLAGLLVPASLRADTLEDVEKKVVELMTKRKSVEMKMKTKLEVSTDQMTEKSESESTVVYAKKNDKWLSRNETKTRGTRALKDSPEEKVESRMVSVYDGEHTYTLIETPELKQATKQKVASYDPFGKNIWEEMKKHMTMKLMGEESVDGKSAWVVETRPKPDPDAPPEARKMVENMRSVTYYRKSDGAAVKSITYDKDKPTVTMTLTDVRYDFEPKPDTFKFTPPEGVTVMDMDAIGTAQQEDQGGASASSDTPSAQPADPKPAPKEEPAEAKPAQTENDAPKEEPKKEKGVKGLLRKLR